MEKISLLLLIAKKTLIGSVIAGMVGFGGLTNFFKSDNENAKSEFEHKRAGIPGGNKPSDPRKL